MNKLKCFKLYYDHDGQQKYVGTFYVRADEKPTELAVHSGLSIKEDGVL